MNPYLIAPSILSADFARLGEDVDKVLGAGPGGHVIGNVVAQEGVRVSEKSAS